MTVIAANAHRYPVSVQCRILGMPRSTYYHMLAYPPRPKQPDPIEPDVLGAFGIRRSVSRPGNPCDNAVVESTNRILKRELVRGRALPSKDRLRTELFDWVNWHNNCRVHSTLGYMTPVGFREAGLILS